MREIDLTGPEGNAMALLSRAKAYAEQLDLDWPEIDEDMRSSDYSHLLDVFEKHFGEYVTFYGRDQAEG